MTQLEGVYLAKPVPMDGFLYVAWQMIGGAKIIHCTTNEQSMAITHLCGHGVETALKAALSKCGLSVEVLRTSPLGHNLVNLWSRAIAEGVPLPIAPEWISQLSRVHSKPYSVRYPLNFHAIALPNQAEMVTGSADLLDSVGIFCK